MEQMEERILKLIIGHDKIQFIHWKHTRSITSPKSPVDAPINLSDDSTKRKTIRLLVDLQQVLSDLLRTDYQQTSEEQKKMMDARIDEKLDTLVEVLGEQLYDILINKEIEKIIIDARRGIEKKQVGSIRLELEFDNTTQEVKEISAWPWEYLRIPKVDGKVYSGEFLANFSKLMLNRRIVLTGETARKIEPHKPANVLLVVAGPLGETGVRYEDTLQTLKKLRDSGAINLNYDLCEVLKNKDDLPYDYKPKVNFSDFADLIDPDLHETEKLPHILHFIGHGKREGKKGKLAFIREGGETDWIDDTEFAQAAARSPNLRLVFLQACESALPDPHAPVSGVAQALASQCIPAIVGMQAKISNVEANTFSIKFYETLAKGSAVDVAVRAGRKAIVKKVKNVAFGVPVLYLWSYEPLISYEPPSSRKSLEAASLASLVRLEKECPRCRVTNTIKDKSQNARCLNCNFVLFCPRCKTEISNRRAKFCTKDDCGNPIIQSPWEEPPGRGDDPPPRLW